MERILRGVLRFSCGGFTYLRIASRLYASAPSDTSAHTGRRDSLSRLFCLPAICLPKNLVYAIHPVSARCHPLCFPPERPHPLASKLVTFLPRVSRASSDLFYGSLLPLFFFGGSHSGSS